MVSKYTTGQTVLIPATIRGIEERNGQIFYKIDADLWNGVQEDQIVIDDAVSARAAFNHAMEKLSREIY